MSVILFTGGVSANPLPRADTPGQTPPGQTPPMRSACWDTINYRAVRILLECILVHLYL